jgi:hypothetical protein
MPRLSHVSLAATLALACAAAVAQAPAGTWKWRDAAGQVHVSDTPPPSSVPDRSILERPPVPARGSIVAAPAPSDGAASAARPAAPPTARLDLELEARRKAAADAQDAQKRAVDEKNAAIKAENCSRARSHLSALAEGQRIARTNDKGEREVLDDKGRADEMQRARAVIASDCRG